MVLEVNDSTIEEVLSTDKVVVLDFWAEWCGPCRMYSTIVEEFAANNPDVVVGKVNVDTSSEVSARYGIRSIPTTIVFKNGEAISRVGGVVNKEKLAELVGL